MLGPELQPGSGPALHQRQHRQQRCLDDPGVAGHHHQGTGMPGHHVLEGSGHPEHEPGPALPARGDRLVRVLVPVRTRKPGAELRPGEPIGLPGVELTESALSGQCRGWAEGPVRPDGSEGRGQQFRCLDGSRQHAGIQGVGAGELAGHGQPITERPHLAHALGGEPGAPLDPPADSRHIALGFAVADQHQAGGGRRAGGGHRADALGWRGGQGVAGGGGIGGVTGTGAGDRAGGWGGDQALETSAGTLDHQASSPTNRSSCRKVRHSMTLSQWTPYSPTMESPEFQ